MLQRREKAFHTLHNSGLPVSKAHCKRFEAEPASVVKAFRRLFCGTPKTPEHVLEASKEMLRGTTPGERLDFQAELKKTVLSPDWPAIPEGTELDEHPAWELV